MGILDEAIREHLELKRQHGADNSELKQLEDDAFGPPERPGSAEEPPDPLAEAPTEFMSQPESLEGETSPEGDGEPAGRRESTAGILDLQEAPAPVELSEEEQPAGEHEAVVEPVADEAGTERPVDSDVSEDAPAAQEGADEPESADGQESGDESAVGHTTEERHAIAEHPTELYDVEGEFSVSGPSDQEDEEAPAASADLEDEDEDFFSEQRLSEELDQALEAPTTLLETQPEPEQPEADEEVESDGPERLEGGDRPEDKEQDEESFEEHEDAGPEEPEESGEGQAEVEDDQPRLEQERPRGADESDVLEGTPDFLEETPEDDELWFEQKPPKDFDFDD